MTVETLIWIKIACLLYLAVIIFKVTLHLLSYMHQVSSAIAKIDKLVNTLDKLNDIVEHRR